MQFFARSFRVILQGIRKFQKLCSAIGFYCLDLLLVTMDFTAFFG